MNRLYIDSIGPLNGDPAENEGYKYILVVIDAFTRWTMLYPLKTLEAKECVRALMQYFGIFGNPAILVSDGGSQVSNALVREILALVGTRHQVTLAYSHQENGMVERVNKEVMRYLRGFLFDQKIIEAWTTHLPSAQRICNTEVNEVTGVSPATLLFGNAVKLDRGIFTENPVVEFSETEDRSEYARKLIAAQSATIEYASKRQRTHDQAHITAATAAITEVTTYKVGDYVLMEYPSSGFTKQSLPPHKLMTNLRGPLQVVSNIGSAYELIDRASGRTVNVHIDKLRPFLYDPLRVDPTAISAKDHDKWLVERVENHRGFDAGKNKAYAWTGKGKYAKRTELQLYVKWIGSEERTWESWTHNMNSNMLAHDYMRKIPCLVSCIAPHFQEAHMLQQAAP